MTPKPLIFFCALLCLTLGACASSDTEQEEEQPGTNALREYVNTPKDKARGAKRKVERTQRRVAEQAQSLVDE